MEDIKTIAISRAIKQLTLFGCTFKVVGQDGEVVADTLPKEEPVKKRQWHRIEKACAYKEKLQNLSPGDTVSIAVPEGVTVKAVQASVTSFMASRFGNGSYISQRSDDGLHVNVLRVE